ncbi:DUF1653 domain-containing protein [Anaeromicropila populeti]|uniref:DUF1653 domain-containing protein n=1 Tax=Anaeromicropila populeti TaxID=37658 RepID=A0A1I6KRA5_9FIRM|nr:DUF1653 domain-containing protein [Anaeromicropila populeti]SFR93783.1 Protein of unknown function [Anaeromicropila populeti]
MEQNHIPRPGEFYRHFKNKYYQIITTATHTETGELLVIYQALYGDFQIYARSLEMFTEKLDKEAYPQALQVQRFEKVEKPEDLVEKPKKMEICTEDKKEEAAEEKKEEKTVEIPTASDEALDKFFDAKSYKDKLSVLQSMRNRVTDKELHDMAVVLDISLEDGSVEEKYMSLVQSLQTMLRFESNRFS